MQADAAEATDSCLCRMLRGDVATIRVAPPNDHFKTYWQNAEMSGKGRSKLAVSGEKRSKVAKTGKNRGNKGLWGFRDQKAVANEGNVSPVGCPAKPEVPRVC